MDYKESYIELLETNKRLEKELELIRSKSQEKSELAREMVFRIFHSANCLMAISKLDSGQYVDVNETFHKSLGYSKEEIIGRTSDDIQIFADFEDSNKYMKLISKLKSIKGYPVTLKTKTGEEKPYLFSAHTVQLENEIYLLTIFAEIKDIQNKQGIVFEKFADLLPEMVYELDLAGKVIYANRQGLDFFGYTKEELYAGINIADIFPDSYKEMNKNLKSLTSPDQISSNEYFGKKKDGSLVPIVTHSFALFIDDMIIGYRGVVTDISKQKEYESQIIREKAFLEHLYNSTPVAIVITSPSGIVSMINREFTNLFGYTLEEVVNKNVNDLLVPDDLKEEAIKIDNLASLNRKEVRQTIRKDKNGNNIHVILVATAIVINNEIVANLGIYRDITTERKNQLLQEILFNISTAALKQYDIKEIYPIIVQELSKIWDTNNFFIALYDNASETLSLPFFTDEKDNFYEIPTKKTITGYVINNNKSVLLKQKDLKLLDESGDIDLVGTPCKVWMGVPLKVENDIIGVMCLQDYYNEDKFSQDDLYINGFYCQSDCDSPSAKNDAR